MVYILHITFNIFNIFLVYLIYTYKFVFLESGHAGYCDLMAEKV